MNKKELNSKDLLLSFLYSPGVSPEKNEPILGRTKITKMMFLFEKQIYKQFFNDTLAIQMPDFEPYLFGPFSKSLFEDLAFFESIGMIVTEVSDIPLSPAEKERYNSWHENAYDNDDCNELSFDESEKYELYYSLSPTGIKYMEERVWNLFSDDQRGVLRKFKAQINSISLNALLRYVYKNYPDQTTNSLIKDRF